MHNPRLELGQSERRELEHIRDHHPKPYVRERAAAVLKLADGLSARFIALFGLLKKREPDTVGAWRRLYLSEGINGLAIKPGRGRKPAFSPSASRRPVR
jgi:hypothetical protein